MSTNRCGIREIMRKKREKREKDERKGREERKGKKNTQAINRLLFKRPPFKRIMKHTHNIVMIEK